MTNCVGLGLTAYRLAMPLLGKAGGGVRPTCHLGFECQEGCDLINKAPKYANSKTTVTYAAKYK